MTDGMHTVFTLRDRGSDTKAAAPAIKSWLDVSALDLFRAAVLAEIVECFTVQENKARTMSFMVEQHHLVAVRNGEQLYLTASSESLLPSFFVGCLIDAVASHVAEASRHSFIAVNLQTVYRKVQERAQDAGFIA